MIGCIFLQLLTITLSLLLTTTSGDVLDDAISTTINAYNIRGVSIAFFNREQAGPILRSYGKVSSNSNSQDVTPETVFMIASISKVFAGTAVLKLVSEGVISLDDDICSIVPSDYDTSSCRNPSWPNTPVTWRMLVTHRSSLRDDIPSVNGKDPSYGPSGGYEGYAVGNPTCPLTDVTGFYRDFMIDKATETSVGNNGFSVDWYNVGSDAGGAWQTFEPGTRSSYSNFAVGYIAALVEFASGQSFSKYCEEKLFKPLGMKNTAWFRQDLPSGILEALPVIHWGGNDRFGHIGHYCFIDYASGSLRTTAKDLSLFLDSMLDYGSPTLWSKGLGETAVRCAEGIVSDTCEYGVSWILMNKSSASSWLNPVMDLDWSDAVEHDGAEVGSQTQVVLFPKAGVYAVVLTNTDGNDEMSAQEVMKQVLLKGPDVAPPPTPTATPPSPTTPSPAPIPSVDCIDNCSFKFPVTWGSNYKWCAWITKNKAKANRRKARYCNKGDIRSQCPATCDPVCNNDPDFRLILSWNGKKKNCRWITNNNRRADQRRLKYCKETRISSSCASACGRCSPFGN